MYNASAGHSASLEVIRQYEIVFTTCHIFMSSSTSWFHQLCFACVIFCEFVPRTNDRKSSKETQWSFPTAGREHSLTKALFTHCVKRNQFVIVRSLCVMTSTKSVYLPYKFITTFNRCKQQNPFKRHSISLVKSCNMVNKNSLIFAPRRCKLKNRASTEIQRHRFPVAEVLSISSLLSSSFHIFLEISIFP